MKQGPGLTLKFAVFATGLAGIVAEFVLSTLATYLVGNAVIQWTLVMSLMLFSMGVGSRVSRGFERDLLDTFILTEFGLSIACAGATVLTYGLLGHTPYVDFSIYALAMLVGMLIGFEIPLVTRLNDAYEPLRVNIATVMEKDYYGALIGGLLFAFVALPRLGLTYTPVVLGSVNFSVAAVLAVRFRGLLKKRRAVPTAGAAAAAVLVLLFAFSGPIVVHGEQRRYKDKVILALQTPYQKIVMTRFKDWYWLFINGQEQFSTYDEEKYHEPLVHPAMAAAADHAHILILGGGDGLALREVLKHPGVSSVTLVDLDPEMTGLAARDPVLLRINRGSFNDSRVTVKNMDAAAFLKQDDAIYGVIIIDLPDPDSVDLMHVYSRGFYRLAARHLTPGGMLVTQAASPTFANKAFLCILKTVRAAGFTAVPYHNPVPTMGHWGWVIATRGVNWDEETLKRRLAQQDFDGIETRFLNRPAMIAMLQFGKGVVEPEQLREVEVNTVIRPVLHGYYQSGDWAMY